MDIQDPRTKDYLKKARLLYAELMELQQQKLADASQPVEIAFHAAQCVGHAAVVKLIHFLLTQEKGNVYSLTEDYSSANFSDRENQLRSSFFANENARESIAMFLKTTKKSSKTLS